LSGERVCGTLLYPFCAPEKVEDHMRSVLILALAVVVLGCSAEATEAPAAAPAADQSRIPGTVLETFDASGYTYLRLETADGEAWAAVPRARLDIGAQVVLLNPQTMSDFESQTLGRTFDTIYFGTLEGHSAASPMAQGGANPHGAMQEGMGSGAHSADAGAAPIEVAKAEGADGRTIAELYADRDDLSGKTVALRGQVVKYSAGIMGRNWIHLQDGTGDATTGTNDVTVTSSGTTAVGEIVVVRGTVAVDKDFGAGYRYAVIVEDASVE
jgi:hypothetical protein